MAYSLEKFDMRDRLQITGAGGSDAAGGIDDGELIALLGSFAWFRRVLEVVAACGAADAWVAAGVIRDLVWDERYGTGFDPAEVKDVDVIFFEPDDLSPAREEAVERALRAAAPDVPWQAKNQAAVHHWYGARFGRADTGAGPVEVEPLTSIADAVGTFPETATAVACRLGPDGIEVVAPFGLQDLLTGIWQSNPRRVSMEEALARIARKQPATRWPSVTVVAP